MNAELGDLADEREWQRLLERKLDGSSGRGKSGKMLLEGFHR